MNINIEFVKNFISLFSLLSKQELDFSPLNSNQVICEASGHPKIQNISDSLVTRSQSIKFNHNLYSCKKLKTKLFLKCAEKLTLDRLLVL